MNEAPVTRLNNHVLFKNLQDKLPRDKVKCMNLIACKNDVLYLWNSVDCCVDSVNIKQVLQETDLNRFVSIKPNPPLLFNVEKISVNRTSTLLALYGTGGISILELPDRWMVKDRIDVPCRSLSQQLFLTEQLKVRQIRWHPGSSTDSHLAVLTSDECIRLYDAFTGKELWSCYLSNHVNRPRNTISLRSWDTPVSFDFSTPIPHNDFERILWPILIVCGNGDIFQTVTTIGEGSKSPIEGPLRMCPSSDDNYGIDACSILVIDTAPPLVVLSTCKGTLYHCVLLHGSESSAEAEDTPLLHVIESIELELGLNLGEGEEEDEIFCPIHLEKDPNERSRYFCIHNAGVHSVLSPIVHRLLDYEMSSDEDFGSFNVPSVVKYLLCTAISSGSELTSSPLLGFTFIDLSKLLILLSNGKLFYVPLPHRTEMLLVKNEERNVDSESNSPQDMFSVYIENMLKENSVSGCPYIKLPAGNTGPQEWLEIVSRVTESYRGILKNHSRVAVSIQKQIQLVLSNIEFQKKETASLNEEKAVVHSECEVIAERYEDINDELTVLLNRAEKVVSRMGQNCSEPLSLAERNMLNTLITTEEIMVGHSKSLERLKSNNLIDNKHQSDNINRQLPDTPSKSSEQFINAKKFNVIKSQLKHLTTQIAQLSKEVKETLNVLSQSEGIVPI